MSTMVRAATLSRYGEVARACGLNPLQALRAAGIDPVILSTPEARVPLQKVQHLLEASARDSAVASFGLLLAEARQLSDMGATALVLRHQRTVRDALDILLAYRHQINEALTIRLEEEGDTAVLREDVVGVEELAGTQSIELAIAVLFRLLSDLFHENWMPLSVHFSHAAPKDLSVHRRIFGKTPGLVIAFGAEFNGIVLARADLDRPIGASDPALATLARQLLDKSQLTGTKNITLEARHVLAHMLPDGNASIGKVAAGLGLSTRTFQRRLDEQGTTFSQLLDDVRKDLALRYLSNPAFSMRDISLAIGYGSLSSYSRWFAQAFGCPPSKWQAAARNGEAGESGEC